MHARTHARTHAHMHSRTHACTHHTRTRVRTLRHLPPFAHQTPSLQRPSSCRQQPLPRQPSWRRKPSLHRNMRACRHAFVDHVCACVHASVPVQMHVRVRACIGVCMSWQVTARHLALRRIAVCPVAAHATRCDQTWPRASLIENTIQQHAVVCVHTRTTFASCSAVCQLQPQHMRLDATRPGRGPA